MAQFGSGSSNRGRESHLLARLQQDTVEPIAIIRIDESVCPLGGGKVPYSRLVALSALEQSIQWEIMVLMKADGSDSQPQ